MVAKNILDISVIIPFKDHSDLTVACVDSLHKYATPVHEIVLVSNNSSPSELEIVRHATRNYKNTKIIIYNHTFNFQKMNNWAAQHAKGKVIFFLNNDIELVENSHALIDNMYQTALQEDIGAVGAVLLYEDSKTIQHAGVYLVPGGTADHLYISRTLADVENKINKNELSYDIIENLEVNAVTAAAVMVERTKFNQIKGFNDAFIICGGDVDLCLRLNASGKKTVLIGSKNGFMIHKESRSRSSIGIPYVDFIESYKSYINHFDINVGDPFIHWKEAQHEKKA